MGQVLSLDHSDYCYSLSCTSSSSTNSFISIESFIVSITNPKHVAQVDSTASVSLHKNLLIFTESVIESPIDLCRAHVLQALQQDLLFSSSSSNKEEEEEEKLSKELLAKKEIKWIKHYNSSQQILLVGEGDFSFSASLALAFGSATNIIATSLNTEGFLSRNYRRALPNIHTLKSRGAKVIYGVDATEMANHCSFQGMSFNRIVFNFPLSGFLPNESRNSQATPKTSTPIYGECKKDDR